MQLGLHVVKGWRGYAGEVVSATGINRESFMTDPGRLAAARSLVLSKKNQMDKADSSDVLASQPLVLCYSKRTLVVIDISVGGDGSKKTNRKVRGEGRRACLGAGRYCMLSEGLGDIEPARGRQAYFEAMCTLMFTTEGERDKAGRN